MNYASFESEWRAERVLKACAKGVVYELNSARHLQGKAISRLADMLTVLQALREKQAGGEFIGPDDARPVNEYLQRHQVDIPIDRNSGPPSSF